MIAYIVQRLLWLPVLLLAVTLVTLALGLYGPGDPVEVLMGQHRNPEVVARIKRERGLDQPFPVQFANYVRRALHGDFGESFKYRGRPVGELIAKRLWVTIQLNLVAVTFGIVVGIPLGIMAALKRNTWLDHLTVAGAVAGIAVPVIAISPILLYIFARQLRVLPPGGWGGVFSTKIILPAFVLSLGPLAILTRQTRVGLIEVMQQDYIRTARAKGLLERMVILRHALRAALIPILTIVGLMLGSLVGGSLFTEIIFGIPGIGRLGFEAFSSRDYPVIMALTLIVAISYVIANLLVDVLYRFVDPRIRYG
ncbi:MAG: ABC transporter permease [Anaerolineae bacterium]